MLALLLLPVPVAAQQEEPLPENLEKRIEEVRSESEARYQALLEDLDAWRRAGEDEQAPGWTNRVTLGGYGEIHLNSVEGPGGDQLDLHRMVGYLGYRFEDWIQLHSEVEIEHALVAPDGDGELSVEQLHVDFLLRDGLNIRTGRFLTPLGIVNETHEPTTFNGVERPLFDTVVIPTTWSTDGAGIFGRFSEAVKYELYLGSSLDGSGFDSVEGIREGRQEGSPGISEPALSGRLDWYPASQGGELRLGTSFFAGGLDNGEGGQNPGVDGDLDIYSADFQYGPGKWEFRGAYAFETISGAANLGGDVASEIDGFNLEAARHILPESWKSGRLEKADLVTFVRYDSVDTQKEMPDGFSRDPRGERDEITFGFSFFPTTGLVVKTDYQIRDDDTSRGLPERFNLGIGWSF